MFLHVLFFEIEINSDYIIMLGFFNNNNINATN